MKRKNNISITYKHYVPFEWIEDACIKLTHAGIKVSLYKDNEDYDNFTGPELSDIIVSIKENPESIILAPAIYDMLKGVLILLFKKLKAKIIKNVTFEGHSSKNDPRISFHYEDPQKRKLEIIFEGEHDQETINKMISTGLDLIVSKEYLATYRDPDFVNNESNQPIIELHYNSDTEIWESINYGEKRRKMNDLLRQFEERFG